MTRGGEGGKKCPKFDDVICERPLISARVCCLTLSDPHSKRIERARSPRFKIAGGCARRTSGSGASRQTASHGNVPLRVAIVGLQPTVLASRAPHLLLEQRIVDVRRPSRVATVMYRCVLARRPAQIY